MKSFSSKNSRRLYGDLSWTWPIISPPEDYIEEAELYTKTILNHSRIEVKALLDLGCGGGHTENIMKKYFKITAVDISEAMLRLAKELNPEVTHYLGDMRTVRLNQLFDAVIIHDAINYMTTVEDLNSAFITAFMHLKPGGVFLTFAEETPEHFKQNKTTSSTHSRGDVEITFIENNYDPDPTDTSYETTFIYLIRHKGILNIQTDYHLLGIFKLETWLKLLKDVGFEVTQLKFEHSEFAEGEYIPMLVCIKPKSSDKKPQITYLPAKALAGGDFRRLER